MSDPGSKREVVSEPLPQPGHRKRRRSQAKATPEEDSTAQALPASSSNVATHSAAASATSLEPVLSMTVHASSPALVLFLLRAINVGGANRLAMKDLKDLLISLNYRDVTTYLQSGNAVGRRPDPDPGELQSALKTHCHLDVSVFMRHLPEIEHLHQHCPYPVTDPTKVYVYFLEQPPQCELVKSMVVKYKGESCTTQGPHLYVHYPQGAGRAKLTIKAIESTLGLRGTGRNWKTVIALKALL